MVRVVNPAPSQTPPGRLARRFSVATAAYTQRRRIATVLAVVIATLLGYHALFGANGVLAYRAKQNEDRMLARQLEKLQQDNQRLKDHVEHLKTDPDAIEYEAHMRLRYTRPDQVIVLNSIPNTVSPGANPATPAKNAQHSH
ncbi:MAG TPA: septum formation initiator family protein [Acidobacteriaceae bacterium]